MKNYYDVLNVNSGASQVEIKKAYIKMVKKYHPDRFQDKAAKEMAEEKLKDINEAYDYLSYATNSSKAYGHNGENAGNNSQNSYSNADTSFANIRRLINNGQIDAAMSQLASYKSKTAEWYYLMGLCYLRKGFYSQAHSHVSQAIKMDPNNIEYRGALNNMGGGGSFYKKNSTGRRSAAGGLCDICSCLICSDCCCECMGGNLIGCC